MSDDEKIYQGRLPTTEGMSETQRKSLGEYEGRCTYCGFGFVTNERKCCLAARHVDQLERELAEAKRELETLRGIVVSSTPHAHIMRLERELARREGLRTALREIANGDNTHRADCAYWTGGMNSLGGNRMPCDCPNGKARAALAACPEDLT